ncbi:MAG: alanyl-tRNA editing protein [Alphaproteobacteria bacterium]|nr:alanyl-tRNA editing protein [Alphaproteobacteria bacterium]
MSDATHFVFRDDPYAQSCEATVARADERGIVIDRTVFYPTGGGQPGDSGALVHAGGTIAIVEARKGETPDSVLHVPAPGAALPAPGTTVTATLDWERRHRHMRVHTCLHLLSAVLPYAVTGGQVSDGKGRLDFDIPEATLDKEKIAADLNRLIRENHAVGAEWITDVELAANPEMVKTMSVKPPAGSGRVRLIRVAGCDLQACGGTHVRATGEIGAVLVTKIEKKGRLNRRVAIQLA